MLFVDEFCGILVYIKFGADVTSQYEAHTTYGRESQRAHPRGLGRRKSAI